MWFENSQTGELYNSRKVLFLLAQGSALLIITISPTHSSQMFPSFYHSE